MGLSPLEHAIGHGLLAPLVSTGGPGEMVGGIVGGLVGLGVGTAAGTALGGPVGGIAGGAAGLLVGHSVGAEMGALLDHHDSCDASCIQKRWERLREIDRELAPRLKELEEAQRRLDKLNRITDAMIDILSNSNCK